MDDFDFDAEMQRPVHQDDDDVDAYERMCLQEAEEQHLARRAPCMKKMPRYR